MMMTRTIHVHPYIDTPVWFRGQIGGTLHEARLLRRFKSAREKTYRLTCACGEKWSGWFTSVHAHKLYHAHVDAQQAIADAAVGDTP